MVNCDTLRKLLQQDPYFDPQSLTFGYKGSGDWRYRIVRTAVKRDRRIYTYYEEVIFECHKAGEVKILIITNWYSAPFGMGSDLYYKMENLVKEELKLHPFQLFTWSEMTYTGEGNIGVTGQVEVTYHGIDEQEIIEAIKSKLEELYHGLKRLDITKILFWM